MALWSVWLWADWSLVVESGLWGAQWGGVMGAVGLDLAMALLLVVSMAVLWAASRAVQWVAQRVASRAGLWAGWTASKGDW